jgi:hypothetical protein
MSELLQFLAENNITEITKEINVSKRMPEKFKIKTMVQSKFNELQKKCTSKTTKEGTSFDGGKFNVLAILECCIYPNFNNADFVNSMKAVTPYEAVCKCLLPGEISELSAKIQELSGFNTDINEEIEEAKN